MTVAHGANGIIMRRPDGTLMSREEVIVRRRGAFLWLPVLFANDLVHGSWWFAAGSFLTALSGIYPLIEKYVMHEESNDDLLPSADFDITWAAIIISGVFFTLGSLAFVRAFEEPPKQALFYHIKHFQTDELLGAWLFLLGTAPSIPYTFVFFTIEPSAFYFFAFLGSIIITLGTGLFVKGCYPTDRKRENYILPIFLRINGAQMWAVKHLANDWLAGCWFFLWANALLTFGSAIMFFIALGVNNPSQIFIWMSGTICSFLFLIGSFYFVSGSYPHAQQFYYATSRRQNDVVDEAFDEMGLLGAPDNNNNATDLEQVMNAVESATTQTGRPTAKVVRVVYNQPLPPPIINHRTVTESRWTRYVAAATAAAARRGVGEGNAVVAEEERTDVEKISLLSTIPSAESERDIQSLPPILSPISTEVGKEKLRHPVAAVERIGPTIEVVREKQFTSKESSPISTTLSSQGNNQRERSPVTQEISSTTHSFNVLETHSAPNDDEEEEEEVGEKRLDFIERSIAAVHAMQTVSKRPATTSSTVPASAVDETDDDAVPVPVPSVFIVGRDDEENEEL